MAASRGSSEDNLTVLVFPAAAKLVGHPTMRRSADHFGIAWCRHRLIGVAELAAAVGVLIGLLWWPTGLLAAAGMILLLIGALITHRRAHDSIREALPALVALTITTAHLATAGTIGRAVPVEVRKTPKLGSKVPVVPPPGMPILWT